MIHPSPLLPNCRHLSCIRVLALTTWLVTSVMAELPPSAYEAMKAKAPVVIEMKVETVRSKKESWFGPDHLETVTAQVIEVRRGDGGLKEGDVITIHYKRLVPSKGWAGPMPPPQLKKGQTRTAWLIKEASGDYGLAAKGRSFE